jgi:hypothetical protein
VSEHGTLLSYTLSEMFLRLLRALHASQSDCGCMRMASALNVAALDRGRVAATGLPLRNSSYSIPPRRVALICRASLFNSHSHCQLCLPL